MSIRADAPPSGAHFTGWIGDVQILADPRSAITTAIVPFTLRVRFGRSDSVSTHRFADADFADGRIPEWLTDSRS